MKYFCDSWPGDLARRVVQHGGTFNTAGAVPALWAGRGYMEPIGVYRVLKESMGLRHSCRAVSFALEGTA